MQQYVCWFLGLADDSYGHGTNRDRFYTDANCRKAYRAWAKHVIRRRDRHTGLRYADDPAVMAWELTDEPRCRSDKSGATLLGWAREVSAYVKSPAPRRLLAVGRRLGKPVVVEEFGRRVDDGSFYPDYDGHRVMWNNDPANPTRTTAQLFAAHAKAMTAAH
ncbi:hypothetical protein HUT16_28295 [Kitasatospora sp. NA04385]|uniref:hypothetical protein n=1 Tax=Kitasatospora sp. NA04385 TaxID=2742135 RepID=UPI001592357F|nr:hypothetical protein [Kitasatospora sp. NA04385]QKW22457.1 hypothetical protein HUT16_28295 [Kitasatospora sp. NA04385]